MGWLSDPCPNADCGARIKKRASFCSRCGWAGPNSLMACAECGKKVGRASRFCWNCGADIARTRAPRLAGDRWVREEDEFAVRVDPADCKGVMHRRVTVEPGTVGLLEHNGRITDQVEWGRQTLDALFNVRQPSSILLFSTADTMLRPVFRRLRDRRGAELDVMVQLVLRVQDYERFVAQFFAGHQRRVTYAMLENRIGHELYDVVRGLISGQTVEEMYGNLEWRNAFEEGLRAAMTVTLDRYGLDLVQLNFVQFGGDHYEQIMKDRGEAYMGHHEADHLAEKVAIRRRVFELQAEGKLDSVTAEKELSEKIAELNTQHDVRSVLRDTERDETIAQARQELEIKQRLRGYELDDLTDERARQKDDEHLAREQMLEKIHVEHQNEVAMSVLLGRNERLGTQDDFERERRRLQSEESLGQEWQASEQRRRIHRADMLERYQLVIEESRTNLERARNEAQQNIEQLRVTEAQQKLSHADREHQVQMLRQVKQMELENIDTLRRYDLEEKKLEVDFKRFERQKQADVELAQVQANVTVATAQERIDATAAQTKAEQLEARLKDQQEDKEALRHDADRRSGDLKEMAGILSQKDSQPTVVVTGGGESRTLRGGGGLAGESPCPNCQRPVPHDARYCPWCSQDMTGKR